jgi:type II secretory pathway component PulF
MGKYRYHALDSSGAGVAGEIDAADSRDAASRLRVSGVFLTDLEGPIGSSTLAAPGAASGPRLSRAQVATVTRQLADLVSSGMPLHRCLSVLCDQASGRQQQLLRAIRQEVQRGTPLSEALRTFSRSFPTLYVEMVRAGETSGHLDAVLQRLAEFLENQEVRRTQVISALTYPSVIVMVAMGAIVFMVTFLVPRLSVVFADLGQALPAPTRVVLALAHAGPRAGPWVALALAALFIAGRKAAATAPVGEALDGALLRLPLLGRLISNATISRFARTMGTLLAGGVPVLDALEIAGAASANRVIAAQTKSLQQRVREGESLSHALSQSRLFPTALVQMTAVGEETGNVSAMLIRYANAADFQYDQAMRRLTSLLEPAVILVMGGIVAFIVLSVLLPVFQIYSSVRL